MTMTEQDHITPPPELIEDWIEIAKPEPWKRPPDPNILCALAAQWGYQQRLIEEDQLLMQIVPPPEGYLDD